MIRLESCDRNIYIKSELPGLFEMLRRIFNPAITVSQVVEGGQGDGLLITTSIDSRLKYWSGRNDLPRYIIHKDKIEYVLEDFQRDSATFVKTASEGADAIRLTTTSDLNWGVAVAELNGDNLRGVVRLIRYIFGGMLFRSGVRFAHASAVAIEGKAYVFTGSSGSGKSSLMFKCCAEVNGKFISDDLVCLWANAEHQIVVSGWPKRIAVGTNLIKEGSILAERLAPALRSPSRYYHDEGHTLSWSAKLRSRIRFDSSEFLQVFGFEGVQSAAAAAVVLPHASPTMKGWHVQVSACCDAQKHLRAPSVAEIRYVTDVLGLFKGIDLLEMKFSLPSIPVVEAAYGPDVNGDFLRFWDEVSNQVF